MKYRIAICDDEQNQIEYITSIVASWSAHEGHSCEIRTFASAEAFLFEYEEDKAYDILLLDVEMKNMNGIELAKRIRKDNNRAEIIFITSHFEFVGEGYEVDALHYHRSISKYQLHAGGINIKLARYQVFHLRFPHKNYLCFSMPIVKT